MRRALVLPLLALSLANLGPFSAEAAPAAARALVVVLPGAGATLIDRMLADGVMPHLARLKQEGLSTSLRPGLAAGSMAGRATLWTGARSPIHGVTGDRLLTAGSVLETRPGNVPEALQAEPLFRTVARSGKPALALHVPHAAVPEESSSLAVLKAEPVADEGLWTEARGLAPAQGWSDLPESDRPPLETTYALAGTPLYGLVFGDPTDPAPGYDTVWLTTARAGQAQLARLKPGAPMTRNAWSSTVPLGESGAHTFFRLFALGSDGQSLLLYHTAPQRWATNRSGWRTHEDWGHVENPAYKTYQAGGFGRPLAEGGDGMAESRYLDTLRFCLYRRQQVARHVLREAPWTVAVNEVPVPAPAVGMWLGYLTPRSPSHAPALEDQLRPALRQVFVEVDAYLGALRQALPPGATMVVASDSGYQPVRWEFMPNVALRRAGLLTVDDEGHVDLSRTRAFFPDTGGQYVIVNAVGRPGGAVKPAETAEVLKQTRAALSELKVKTPGGVVSLVRAMWEPTPENQRTLGLAGPAGTRLYMSLQSGYGFSPAVTGDMQFIDRLPNQSAAPATYPEHPDAQGALILAGPAIQRGAVLKGVRAIDLAPTVARLVGAPAPAKSQGRALGEALR